MLTNALQNKALITSFGIGALVFAIIIWVIGPNEVLSLLMQVEPMYLLLALGLQVLAIAAMAQRWKVFIEAAGQKTNFHTLFLMTIAGTAMNNITPSARMGGEPLRAYLLKKEYGLRTSAGLATVIIEKIADMTTFSIITIAAIIYSFYFLNVPGHTVFLLVVSFFFTAAITAALIYVSLSKKIKAKWFIKLIDKYQNFTKQWPIVHEYREKMDDSLANYYKYVAKITSHRVVIKGMFWSLVYWSLEIARAYVLFLAFGINVPIAIIAAVYVLANIVGSLPLPPGSIEATMIIIYSSTAINTVTAGTVTLIDRLVSFWLVILAGVPITWYLGVTKNKK